MKINKIIYHCNHCKKIIESLESLYFVETGSPRGFCSEPCIEAYFSPIVNYYEKQEKFIRKHLNIETEDCKMMVEDPMFMEQVLQKPDEIWRLENELKEEVFSFITKMTDNSGGAFYVMVLCLVFNSRPSFILAGCTTKSEALLSEYRIGEKVTDTNSFSSELEQDNEKLTKIENEMNSTIEHKKSIFLAKLLEDRVQTDIKYEDFMKYEEYSRSTLENADEIYTQIDEEGDDVLIYIKAHEKDEVPFYYFIICMQVEIDEEQHLDALLPIISFPSIDGELYKKYRKGRLVSGGPKN